ncbi:MAG: hypothetical protein M3Y37_02285 [Chloroflexota bacterium]|jgi:hypothetical protein|nr:hypothetical protein [Chloroflexota bacterium]
MTMGERGAARGWLPKLDAGHFLRTTTVIADPALLVEDASGDATSDQVAPDAGPDWSAALESQFGLRSGGIRPPSASHVAVDPVQARIADLEQRLAYYEHFDALIRDNVARSAELFRAVFAEREKARTVSTDAEAMMEAVSAEAERRVSAERHHMQHILVSLMDEATFLQQRSDALVQRVAEAITEMTAFRDEDDEPVSGA